VLVVVMVVSWLLCRVNVVSVILNTTNKNLQGAGGTMLRRHSCGRGVGHGTIEAFVLVMALVIMHLAHDLVDH
jgi:hypothetical protein